MKQVTGLGTGLKNWTNWNQGFCLRKISHHKNQKIGKMMELKWLQWIEVGSNMVGPTHGIDTKKRIDDYIQDKDRINTNHKVLNNRLSIL